MTKNWRKPNIRKYVNKTRNYDDPAYKKFRSEVLLRDLGCCQWHGCGSTKQLCVHHIRTWSKYPHLRFEITNGISLCREHHNLIWGKEQDYEKLFLDIIKQIAKNPDYAKRDKNKKFNKNIDSNSFATRYAKAKIEQRKKRK